MLDIEQGQEVFILNDISQRNLPLSFRYYDPIIKIIFSKMTKESKEFYNSQTNSKLDKLKEDNKWIKFKDSLINAVLETDKLSYRPSQLNVPDKNEAQFLKSFNPEDT